MVRDERNLEGKICVFNTHGMDSEWKIHDGEKCTVKSVSLRTNMTTKILELCGKSSWIAARN